MRNQTTAKYNIDDFDDLTRFADESFDTDEADLFQFSSDESSPLTRLKSVILSLDWDITDEYLQELADELAHLAPDWQEDKVASLYLQGMGKIGKYLRLRGAYAHPNSIKLLLTYFHDFETFVSSPDLSSDHIAQMVHNDVRKFKVLQYQIKLREEGASAEDAAATGKGLAISRETGEAGDSLRNFKAAILELDWEVSDDSLARFSAALKALGEEKIQNKSALILIQGMQALGQYISDERAQAHPEVFNLLHSFHDGLEQILDTGPAAPDQHQKKNILLDKVNRLNHLKTLIAPKDSEIPATIPIPQAAAQPEPVAPVAGEAQEAATSAAFISEATAPDPVPVATGTLTDAEQVSLPEIENPAASESDEELKMAEVDIFSGTEAAAEPAADAAAQASLAADFPIELDMEEKEPVAGKAGIASEIDALFAASSKRAMLSSDEEYPEEELPASAYEAVDDEVSDIFIDTNVGERHGITPALADVAEETELEESREPLDMETKIDLDEQLDFLFGATPQGAEQSEPAASLFDEEFEDPAAPAESLPHEETELFTETPVEDALFLEDDTAGKAPAAAVPEAALPATGSNEDDDEEDETSSIAVHDEVPAALADVEVPAEDLFATEEPADEKFTGDLDSFFAAADEAVASAPPSLPEKEEELAITLEEPAVPPEIAIAGTEPVDDVVAALSDVEPAEELFANQAGEAAALAGDDEDPVLQNELNNFFDSPAAAEQEPTDVERAILAVEPEETDEEYLEEEALTPAVEAAPLESALADVAFAEKTAGQSIKVDPAIEQFVNSFWDDKPSGAASPLDSAAETPASDEVPTLADEGATQKQPADVEKLFTAPESPAPDTATGELEELEANTTAEAAVMENDASAQDIKEAAAEPAVTDPVEEELQLEKSNAIFSPAAAGFEDILDSSEVQEFLLSGQDIEDIPDEELEFSVKDEGDDEELSLAESTSLQEEALFDTPAGAQETAHGADDGNAEPASDALMTEEASSTEEEAAFASVENYSLAVEDDLPAAGASVNAPLEGMPEAIEEAGAGALAALGASLPVLLNNCTPEHLSTTSEYLQSVRETSRLSPVQSAAAGMLETVITALPRHSGQDGKSRAVVDRLYQALVQPQEHLPVDIVSSYTGWVQSLLSETLLSEAGEPDAKEYFTARDIYQELSGFRARMEEELAQLREEIRNK